MHSHKLYIYEGVNAIPSAEENPHLTQKINNLHQLLVRRDRRSILNAAANNPTPPSAPTAPLTRTVQTRSNLTLDTLSNMNGSQLQLLLPIPLSKDQRWLMVTLGTDFTHIWLPQWRNFLSVKRIRSALAYAAQTQKTIQLSSPNSHPSVFVTGVRHNQIFIGPYQINESQQLTLYFRDTSGQFHLSECYAKLPNVPPFLRRSIGKCFVIRFIPCQAQPFSFVSSLQAHGFTPMQRLHQVLLPSQLLALTNRIQLQPNFHRYESLSGQRQS